MNLAIFILAHPGAQHLVDQNYPHWIAPVTELGATLFGVEHEDKPAMNWPVGVNVLRLGTDPDTMIHRWVSRFIQVLAWARQSDPRWDYFIFIEADTIFLEAPSEFPACGGTLAGFDSAGFFARRFYHCPWCFSRAALGEFMSNAEAMLAVKLTEQGMIDRFLGLMDDLYKHRGFTVTPLLNWSRNTAEIEDLGMIEWAMKNGAWAVHGVKSPHVLESIIRTYEHVERDRRKTRHRPKQQPPRLSQSA